MIDRLKLVFEEVAKLPHGEQEQFAEFMLAELRGEREWTRKLEASPQVLERLADEALREHREGKTRPLDELIS